MKRKCYISGPITGLAREVYLANFKRGCELAEAVGCEAVNPCELDHSTHDQSWDGFMRVDIKAMLDCTAILLLYNWHESAGAKLEYYIAQMLRMNVYVQEELEHPDMYEDCDEPIAFDPCNECKQPDACMDFGCPYANKTYPMRINN